MRASYARRTTLTYASAAVLCVVLPLVTPAEHEPVAMTMALFVGAPLAVLAVLLALLHIAVGLQARADWLIATVFAVAAVLGIQPMWYWWPALGTWLVRVVPVTSAFASAALAWLAVRAWRASSPTRYVLGSGVGLVSLRLAASAYLAIFDVRIGIDAAAQSMSDFLVDCAVAAVVLLVGLIGHKLFRRRATAAGRLTRA